MAYVFMDESGDMGFDFSKPKTSKYFVIACVITQDRRPLEKIIKKIFKDFSPKERKRHQGVLHMHKENSRTRRKVLESIIQKDVSIVAIYLNKSKVYTRLQDEKHVLYNYVTNILLDRLIALNLVKDQQVTFVASKRETNKLLNENFKNYIQTQTNMSTKIDIETIIRTPSQEKCLQIADAISWSLFRNREHNDDTYYNIIRGKIASESPLFP